MTTFDWGSLGAYEYPYIWGPAEPNPTPPLGNIIPSYPYLQYSDDPNIVAFFTAYNTIAQAYLEWFNSTPLSVYTLPSIAGPLLDWIGQGIYGKQRPVFATFFTRYIAGLNSYALNTLPLDGSKFTEIGTATVATDDYYKRLLTWWNYLGNGKQFNIQWLRWRVARFIYGANGGDVTLQQQATIHVLAGLLAPPPAPTLASVAGGSLPTTTYYAASTYVTPKGETLLGPVSKLAVAANHLLVVQSPPIGNGASGWNNYVAKNLSFPAKYLAGLNAYALNSHPLDGSNYPPVPWERQNTAPLAIGTNWLEPTTGLIFGGLPPIRNGSNTATNLIITVPPGTPANYLQQGFAQGLFAFPFMLTGEVVIA